MVSGPQIKKKIVSAATLLSGLAYYQRLTILYMVSRDPCKPMELSQALKLPAPAVAHHIKYLLKNGWITKEKYGKIVLYSINEATVKKVWPLLRDIFHVASEK
jgi:DNA-binding transcriptional ArsR family regulator